MKLEDLLPTEKAVHRKEQAEINRYKITGNPVLKRDVSSKSRKIGCKSWQDTARCKRRKRSALKKPKTVDETIRNLTNMAKQMSTSEMEKIKIRLRDKMNASQKKLSTRRKIRSKPQSPGKLQIGDTVKATHMNLKEPCTHFRTRKRWPCCPDGNFTPLVNINDRSPRRVYISWWCPCQQTKPTLQ